MKVTSDREECFERIWYKFAAELLPEKKGKVVDLGSGACEFSRLMRDRGFQVVCTDISHKNVNHAMELEFEAHQVDFNEKLPFKKGEFEGAVALEVVEHIMKAERFIGEISRILKKGGWLILSTPNVAWLPNRVLALFGKPPVEEGYHFRFFTKKNLENVLSAAGFGVKRWNSFLLLPYLHKLCGGYIPVRAKRAQSLMTQKFVVKCKKLR